jgi:hypothetical protein
MTPMYHSSLGTPLDAPRLHPREATMALGHPSTFEQLIDAHRSGDLFP